MNNELIEYFNGDDLAANVWQGKYQAEGEITPNDMHKRMAKEFARIEANYIERETDEYFEHGARVTDTLSTYGRNRSNLTERRIFNLFRDFQYVIPQGSIMAQLGTDTIGSLSNCFVIGQPADSFGGIFQKDEEIAQLEKRRGGVGIDISTLRPQGTATSNTAKTSTGACTFMHRFSNTTREVAQNGRRGALMISMDVNHPDIMIFIKTKRDLSQVTGANISIKLNDDFMNAVVSNEDYILRFPCDSIKHDVIEYSDEPYLKLLEEDGVFFRRIKAREYWEEIIKSAHGVAEPGLMFWNKMVEYSPDGVYSQFRQITTNPCSEIAMQPYDACRLIALNLYSFVDYPFHLKATFNFKKFYKYNYEAMRICDDVIDLEVEHIDTILRKLAQDSESKDIKKTEIALWKNIRKTALTSRRTGLSFTALGDTLAALNLKYDSKEALEIIDAIMTVKMRSELDCTTDLAILREPFKGWNSHLEVYDTTCFGNDFYKFLYSKFPKEFERMQLYGRRNVSWSTVAPTGTVSLMAQTTSGIEPLFQPYYIRRKKINPSDEGVEIHFVDENGDMWQEFNIVHPKFKDWINQREDVVDCEGATTEELDFWFRESPWYGSTANNIDWIKRIDIQAIIQKYISHSISSTINLPNKVTEDEVSNIYLEAWRRGLKGITVYRDGSRSGVLVTTTSSESFEHKDAQKRPKCLNVDIHTAVSEGVKWNVIIGLVDDKPYEVFTIPYFTTKSKMELCKRGKGKYDLIENNEVYSEDITSKMNFEQEVVTRLISTSLRHRTDIKFIVEQLNKTKGDMFSFIKVITRILKKYIPDGAKSTVICNECNSNNVIFEEGCNKCLDCGSSKCG